MAETRHYPDDHPTRKGCKIVACEADQKFLDELYRYPKDHPFSIRYGGNLYVRGGERIDPDDPNAVRPRRPRLSRQAAKTFISGSGEDILNEGQRQDDSAAERARKNYEWKDVSLTVLWDYNLIGINVFKVGIWLEERLGPKHCLIHSMLNNSRTRNKRIIVLSCIKHFYLWGNELVERQVRKLHVQIIARSMVWWTNLIMNECNYYTLMYNSNDIELIMRNECKLMINTCIKVNYLILAWFSISQVKSTLDRGRSLKSSVAVIKDRGNAVKIQVIEGRMSNNKDLLCKLNHVNTGSLILVCTIGTIVPSYRSSDNWKFIKDWVNGRSLNGKAKVNKSARYKSVNDFTSSKKGSENWEANFMKVVVNINYDNRKPLKCLIIAICNGNA